MTEQTTEMEQQKEQIEQPEETGKSFVYYTALLGMIAPIIWVVIIITFGALHPDYNHLTDFMSTLGGVGEPNAWGQRANFFILGGTIILLTFSLYKKMDQPSVTSTILMLIIGTGIFLSGIFSEDQIDPDSFTSMMHDLVGFPVFILLIFFPYVIGRKFEQNEEWEDLSMYSKIMSPSFFIFLVLMLFFGEELNLTGLFQRLFLGLWLVWIEMVSYRLYKLET